MNYSHLFDVDYRDVVKSIIVVVLAALLGAIEQALTAHGLDVMTYDWQGIMNVGLTAGGGYLIKNFFSDKDGKVLGKIG